MISKPISTTVDAPGFDLLRIHTGHQTELKSLQLGESRTETAPAEIIQEPEGLLIHLPERITRANNPPIRIVFDTEIFEFATTFQSEGPRQRTQCSTATRSRC